MCYICGNSADFIVFSMIWYCRNQLTAVSKQQDARWYGFADRFRYQLTIFKIREVIGLSRLVHANIAYKIVTTKIIAAFCRISYCMHDLIRMNSIVCHLKRARCLMVWFSMIDSDINCLTFAVCILIGLSQLLDTPIAYKYRYKTSPHITCLMRETISHSVL